MPPMKPQQEWFCQRMGRLWSIQLQGMVEMPHGVDCSVLDLSVQQPACVHLSDDVISACGWNL